LDVHGGEESASGEAVDDLGNQWGYVSISDGVFVDGLIILYGSQLPILLFYEEEVGCIPAL
jgi:hypothetical protein